MLRSRCGIVVTVGVLLLPRIVPAQELKALERWPDGKVRVEAVVDAEGRRDGLCREYDEAGRLRIASNYEKGVLVGRFETYFENGQRSLLREYGNGKLNGNSLELAPDGTRLVASVYRDDVLSGPYQSWHQNGQRFVVTTYRKGLVQGAYEETDPTGSRTWKANFENGVAHGEAVLTRKDLPPLHQTWRDGMVVLLDGIAPHPRSEEAIREALGRILETAAQREAADLDTERRRALARLAAYRSLAGLPHANLELDPAMNEACAAAADVCAALGRITHTPSDPGGLPPGRYELGKRGAGNSNLSAGASLPRSIDGYMDDSDPSNVRALGHRRWCLNPALQKTGFGWTKGFSAMWSMDRSGPTPKDLEVVAWPPPGFLPLDFIEAHWAWSFSFLKGKWPGNPEPEVVVHELDDRFLPVGAALGAKAWVAEGGYGISRCIAASIDGVDFAPGRRYLVRVSFDAGKSDAHRQIIEFIDPISTGPVVR